MILYKISNWHEVGPGYWVVTQREASTEVGHGGLLCAMVERDRDM